MILPSFLPTFSHFSYTTARLSEITTMTYFIMYLTMDITKCREKNLFVERLSESLETNVFNFILIHFSWALPCISGLSRILCCMMENTTAHEGASIGTKCGNKILLCVESSLDEFVKCRWIFHRCRQYPIQKLKGSWEEYAIVRLSFKCNIVPF